MFYVRENAPIENVKANKGSLLFKKIYLGIVRRQNRSSAGFLVLAFRMYRFEQK